ncbi:hypothetical protein TNCV_2811731 [Trichonephila clavipes]|nr:hypothetical protein TNCV_2811731 [Trichonephila clavipes]
MYVLSRKQQNIMNEIENAKQDWAMDQMVILSTKLNKMKEKNDLIQRKIDLLKEKNDVLKTKEQELKTTENELKTKEKEFDITRLNFKLQVSESPLKDSVDSKPPVVSKSPDPPVKKVDSVIHRSPRSRERRNEEKRS